MPRGRGCIQLLTLMLVVLVGAPPAWDQPDATDEGRDVRDKATTIYVDVQTSSWKPRGRVLYDVEGSIRSKLSDAGLEVVRVPDHPRDFVLSVEYHESRGEQYAINSYGTIITCTFTLSHEEDGSVFAMTIDESSRPSRRGTPPYLEALQRFQTNPYYYFLGHIVAGRLQSQLNRVDALVAGLRAHALQQIKEESSSSEVNNPHTMQPSDKVYGAEASLRAVEELGRLQHTDAIPVLITLLEYPDARVQAKTRQVLESMEAKRDPAADSSSSSPS